VAFNKHVRSATSDSHLGIASSNRLILQPSISRWIHHLLQYIPVVLDLQRIMVIPEIGFQLSLVLLAHPALMQTPGSQLVMAHQTIEKPAGNIVSGKGVEIRDATLLIPPPDAHLRRIKILGA
jgi:hypothetical protein